MWGGKNYNRLQTDGRINGVSKYSETDYGTPVNY